MSHKYSLIFPAFMGITFDIWIIIYQNYTLKWSLTSYSPIAIENIMLVICVGNCIYALRSAHPEKYSEYRIALYDISCDLFYFDRIK